MSRIEEIRRLMADPQQADHWNALVLQDAIRDLLKMDGAFSSLVAELARARTKFPGTGHLLAALTEEVGELARALLQQQGDDRVKEEAIQVACVAIRIATEGDSMFANWVGQTP